MNSASFYAPLKKRVEIKLPAEHSDDDLGLSSDEDELKEYLPGERETDEEDESDMNMEKLLHGLPCALSSNTTSDGNTCQERHRGLTENMQ